MCEESNFRSPLMSVVSVTREESGGLGSVGPTTLHMWLMVTLLANSSVYCPVQFHCHNPPPPPLACSTEAGPCTFPTAPPPATAEHNTTEARGFMDGAHPAINLPLTPYVRGVNQLQHLGLSQFTIPSHSWWTIGNHYPVNGVPMYAPYVR